MDNSLLAVRFIDHKYFLVGGDNMLNYLFASLIEIGINPYKGLLTTKGGEREYIFNIGEFIEDTNWAKVDKAVESGDYTKAIDPLKDLKNKAGELELDSVYFYMRNMLIALNEKNTAMLKEAQDKLRSVLVSLEDIVSYFECEASS